MTDADFAQSINDQLDAFRHGAAVFAVAKDVVSVCGPDARSFLQSLVSQDVAQLLAGDAADALLLQPQGKLIAAMKMFVLDEQNWLLVCDAGSGSALHDGLARFKIRVKVELKLRDDLAVLSVRGPLATAATQYDASNPAVDIDAGVLIPWDWNDASGVDWVGPQSVAAVAAGSMLSRGATMVAEGVYETARIDAGVLVQGLDIDDRTIAQEAQLEVDAVSFTKGCFVGQELVCRIDSRGHVNRFVRRLRAFDDSTRFTHGDIVTHDGAAVGEVTSAAPLGAFALATIRRTVEPGTAVIVAGAEAWVEQRLSSERTKSSQQD